jgi:hypothetical protein
VKFWLGQMSRLSGLGREGLKEEKNKWVNVASKGRTLNVLVFLPHL